jgi:hypothetical protein
MGSLLLRERLFFLFLIIFTAIIMISPLASNTLVPNDADMVNHLAAIIQAKMALVEGQFPLRVTPFLHSGWRYPFYQFYSPSANLVGGALFLLTPANPFIAFKLIILFAAIAGGIYMYRLTNELVNSSSVALLASVTYMTSPYYLIVLDHMYDFTEGFALGLMPIVLYYTLKLFYLPTSLKFFLLTALLWYLLATIHLITFFYAFMFLAFLLMLFTLKNRSYWRNLLCVGGGFFFAIGLSAWFFIPIVLFKQYLWVEHYYGIDQAQDYYSTSFTSLFSPIANIIPFPDKASAHVSLIFKLRPNIGIPFLFAMGMSIYIFIKQKKLYTRADAWLTPLIITAFLILLFIWSPFKISQYLPQEFLVGQYSWRLFGQFTWVATLLFAIGCSWLFPAVTLTKKNLFLGCFCIIFSTGSWYLIPDIDFSYADLPTLIHAPYFDVADEIYLTNPATLGKYKPLDIRKLLHVMPVEETKKFCHQDKIITKCGVPVSSDVKWIELPIFYYPQLLSISLNGKNVPYQGMIFKKRTLLASISSAPNTINNVEIKFVGLTYANRISRLSWGLWIILLLYAAKRVFVWPLSGKQEFRVCSK